MRFAKLSTNALLVLAGLALSQPTLASTKAECAQVSKALLQIANSIIDTAAWNALDQEKVVTGYNEAGYGPGPGMFAQKDYLVKLTADVKGKVDRLDQLKKSVRASAQAHADCFDPQSK